jgi:hypothetical protein
MGILDDWLKKGIQKELGELQKNADPDAVPEKRDEVPDDDKLELGRKAILTDPFYTQQSQQTLYKYRLSRLSNKTLKDVSLRDWLVSAIIQNRIDLILRFSRPQIKKFDYGFRIVKHDEAEEYTKDERSEIEDIQAFIYNCGRRKNTPDDDKMLFGEFLKLVVRDALTFGNITVEKVKTRRGALHRFRPVPAESVYHINQDASKKQIREHLKSVKDSYEPKSDNDPRRDQKVVEQPLDYYKYVQVSYDQRPLAVFGDEDMIFRTFNPQNFSDSQGYCYSPLELVIINATHHMNTEHYNSNFFTHGQAAKGVLHLKGTVTQSQMTAFRRQFYNLINGAQHAWRTPIIAGLEDVQWVPMAGGSKDMEYLNYNMHLMRAICTQFQIDPMELGLDMLATGGKAVSGQEGNQAKIEFSREKGFYPILIFLEDFVNNDIIPAIDPEYSKKYKFQFEGYTDETPQTEVALLQAEMTVNKTMNDLLTAARKEKIKHPVGDLPMNESFWSVVERNMTRGEIRETFFEDKGASAKKELQYIPQDPAFLNWQQMLFQIEQTNKQEKQMEEQMQQQQQQMQMQQQQMEQEAQQQAEDKEHEKQLAEAEHSRDQEKHDAEMNQIRGQAAYNASQHGKISTKDLAKMTGNSGSSNVGGVNVANPLNKSEDKK